MQKSTDAVWFRHIPLVIYIDQLTNVELRAKY